MRITIKSISNQIQEFEMDSTSTVKDLREKASTSFGIPVNQIILIFKGTVLENDQQIQSINYSENKYIVIHKQIKPVQPLKKSSTRHRSNDGIIHKRIDPSMHITPGSSDSSLEYEYYDEFDEEDESEVFDSLGSGEEDYELSHSNTQSNFQIIDIDEPKFDEFNEKEQNDIMTLAKNGYNPQLIIKVYLQFNKDIEKTENFLKSQT